MAMPAQRLAFTPPVFFSASSPLSTRPMHDQDDAVEADQPGDDVADVEGAGRVPAFPDPFSGSSVLIVSASWLSGR